MGVSLYLTFFNKLAGPKSWVRLMLLITVFVAYLMMGGYLFSILNMPTDMAQQNELINFEKDFGENHQCISNDEIKEFIMLIVNTSNSGIIFGEDSRNVTQTWLFGGEALFFTFTLLSTIGYGHIVTYAFIFLLIF
jgi:hypothetical protein